MPLERLIIITHLLKKLTLIMSHVNSASDLSSDEQSEINAIRLYESKVDECIPRNNCPKFRFNKRHIPVHCCNVSSEKRLKIVKKEYSSVRGEAFNIWLRNKQTEVCLVTYKCWEKNVLDSASEMEEFVRQNQFDREETFINLLNQNMQSPVDHTGESRSDDEEEEEGYVREEKGGEGEVKKFSDEEEIEEDIEKLITLHNNFYRNDLEEGELFEEI